MNSRKSNCQDCVHDSLGTCVNSVWVGTATQGQVKACPKGSHWNYEIPGYLQMRANDSPLTSFLTTATPLSLDLANPVRQRPNTHRPTAPQHLAAGSMRLPFLDLSSSPVSMNRPYSLGVLELNESMDRLAPRSYCQPGNQNCAYAGGLNRAGHSADGCVPLGKNCDKYYTRN